METLFSKIISGEIPSYKVAENDNCYAFLDINPNTKGHVLCVPKQPVDKLFDLSEEEYIQLMTFSRKVAIALREVIPCKRVGMSVVGLEVPHAHVHLIPLQEMNDIRFNKKVQLSAEEMEKIAETIASFFTI
ncbi:MAG: HIT family protein [Flavobacteriaceae bacterium]